MISFSNANGQIRLFTGTYTEGPQKGLFIFDLDREAGTFKLVSGNDAGPNPSYFCISKKNGFIYAANEVGDFNGVKGGGVTALSYDAKTGVTKKSANCRYQTEDLHILLFLPEMIICFWQTTQVDQSPSLN